MVFWVKSVLLRTEPHYKHHQTSDHVLLTVLRASVSRLKNTNYGLALFEFRSPKLKGITSNNSFPGIIERTNTSIDLEGN